jgi:putative membrane protein insertion efficiency factor
MEGRSSVAATLLRCAIAAYQVVLSPLLGGTCRFWPPCSGYADQAVRRHGAWRGTLLALGRLARCRPFGPFGYDPVPDPPVEGRPRRAGTGGG